LMYEQIRFDSPEICPDLSDMDSINCGNEDNCKRFYYCENDLKIRTLLKELKAV